MRTVTDPNQNPDTRLSYDALGRLQNTVDALSQSTEYQYNLADKTIAVQSPNGATTRFSYDDLGNQLIEVSPDRGIIEYHYNAAGSVVQSRDARNITIDYRYDALNRLTAVIYPEKTSTSTVSYQYDKGKGCLIGALCSAKVGNNATTYQYNGWGNITQQRDRIAGITNTTHYRYDTGNRVIGMTYPDGAQLGYQRDALGRITSVQHNDAMVVSKRTYRADGQFTSQTLSNKVTEQRDYDQQGRLSAQRFSGASSLDDVRYTHDANGNVLSRATQRYGYDALNRLVNDSTSQYGYDANSNRLSKATNSATQTLDYFSHSNQLFSHNSVELEYDAVGNQLNDQLGRQLQYNQAGQLVKVSQHNTTIAEYHYNAFNQRVMKQSQHRTTRFTYDLQGQLIQESTRSNKQTSQNNDNTRIVWLDNQPIQQVANNTHTAIISDHLNTPRIGLDQNANTTWRWVSDGFGHTEPANDPDGNGIKTNIKLRFPGQYADQETGLYYNWHRYYDPATGRYVTSDPIGLLAGINTYGYVGGNPVGVTDPSGLNPFCPFDGIDFHLQEERESRLLNGEITSDEYLDEIENMAIDSAINLVAMGLFNGAGRFSSAVTRLLGRGRPIPAVSVDSVLAGSTITSQNSRLIHATRSGGVAEASSLFNSLRGSSVATTRALSNGHTITTASLPSGGSVSVRPFSTSQPSRPTVQINRAGEIPVKIRFD